MKPVEIEFLMKDNLSGGLDKAGQSASSMEDAFKQAGLGVDELKSKIETLKSQQKQLQNLINDSSKWGKPPKALTDEYDKISQEIAEAEQRIAKYSEQINNAEKVHTSLRTQIKSVKDEMAALRNEAQKNNQTIDENTGRYAELRSELGRLTQIQKDVAQQANVLSNHEMQFQGIIQGVSGLAGGFSAATGAISLFAGENENLQKIMTKLQSVMAITIGLQQVAQTLNKDSAFMLVTVRKAKELLTAVETKFAISLGISNIAAKALMVTLTLGLSVAIGAAIYLWDKFSTKAQEAKKTAEEFNKSVSEIASKPISAIKELSIAWSKLGDDIKAKEKFIDDNKSKFESLGVSINSVADAERLLIKNTKDFVESQILKAKATIYTQTAADKTKTLIEKQQELENVSLSWWQVPFSYGGAKQKMLSEKRGELQEEIKSLNEEIRINLEKSFDFTQEEQEILSKLGQSTNNIVEGTIADLTDKINKLKEAQKKAGTNAEYADLQKKIDINQKLIDKITGGKKDKSQINKEQKKLDAENQLTEIEQEKAIERERFDLDMRQKEIDRMNDSFKKRFQQLILNQDKELQAIKEFEQNKLKEQQKIEKDQWKQGGSIGTFTPKTVSVEQLPEDIKEQAAQMGEAARAAFASGISDLNKQIWESLREQEVAFKSTLEKELSDLDAHYKEMIEKAEGNERLITLLKENQAKARKEAIIKNRLSEIDFNEELETERAKGLESISMTELAEEKKLEIQRKCIKLRIEALKQLAEAGNEDAKKQVAILEKSLKNSEVKKPLSLKALGDKAIFDAIKKNFQKIGDSAEEAEEKTIKLLSSIPKVAGTIANIAGELKSVFGGLDEGLDEVLDTVGNIANGFAQGGIIGGITAVVGEGIKLLNKASEAEARHQEALKEITREKTAFQREYNLLLIKQNELLKNATTIFGVDAYGKASGAILQMKSAYEKLNEAMKGDAPDRSKYIFNPLGYKKALEDYKNGIKGLADIEVKTGHKKTGLFGWGKGKDIYSSILDVIPELIDETGKFDAEVAKLALNTRTMSDDDKAALQYMIDLAELAEEAFQAVKDYLSDIFGELGGNISDALVDAFRNGTDAAEKFTKSVTGMLEDLAEQMIYSVTIAPYLAKAQEDMLNIMQNENLTNEQKFNGYVGILDGMMDDVLAQQGAYNAMMEEYKQMAASKGLNLWEPDSKTQSGKAGAYEAASQESITRLEGLYSSMLEHSISIDDSVENIVEGMSIALGHLRKIEENTGSSDEHLDKIEKAISTMKDDIAAIKRDGIKTR